MLGTGRLSWSGIPRKSIVGRGFSTEPSEDKRVLSLNIVGIHREMVITLTKWF